MKGPIGRACVLAANLAENAAVLRDVRSGGSSRERLSRAVAGWYRCTIEAPGVPTVLAEAWAAASRKPLIRALASLLDGTALECVVGIVPTRAEVEHS